MTIGICRRYRNRKMVCEQMIGKSKESLSQAEVTISDEQLAKSCVYEE